MDNGILFSGNPVKLDISRTKFPLDHNWSGTITAGKLVPFLGYSQILPGDTFKVNTNLVIRSTTPIQATMDQLYADVYYFFVPHKLVLSRQSMSSATNDAAHDFEAFIGAQSLNLNMPTPSAVSLPSLRAGSGSFVGSLADYFGIPFITNAIDVEPFEFLSYWKVWNDYFRDENTQNPVTFSISSGSVRVYGGPYSWSNQLVISDSQGAGKLLPVSRFHGYFGSSLPWPQRATSSVTLPLGTSTPLTLGTEYDLGGPIKIAPDASQLSDGSYTPFFSVSGGGALGLYAKDAVSPGTNVPLTKTNLYVDLENATAASVNSLRIAIQTQKWYEKLARGGNRLRELTQTMFGVTPHDYLTDTPEYLGGKRIALNMTQVASMAGSSTSSATQFSLGSTGAFSLTSDSDYYFTKSFDTWGTILGVMCIRPHESFHQGLHRRWTKFDKFDYYWPTFAHIGEQPIYEKEIYCDGSVTDENVFGYQEAWAEYRYLPDVVTGLLRPGVTGSISYWTYVNNFASAPTLQDYLNGDQIYKNIDQTLQVNNATAGFQFLVQVGMKITAIRPLPLYSDPGYMDHF